MTDYLKDPASTRSYTFDRTYYLAPGAKITASSWEVPAELSKASDSFTDNTTQITVAGGVTGTNYPLYNTFATDDGQTFRVAFILRVIDAVLIREPTALERQLEAVRVALGQKAAQDTEEYSIANRMKKRYSFEDLLAYEKRLTDLVNGERRQAAGPGFFKNHFVRPTEPGP